VLRQYFYQEIVRIWQLKRPAEAMTLEGPTFCATAPHGQRADRQSESKRVCSHKIQRDLQLVWRYPTYREGLMAILT
jgi:hypothetical protein